MASILANRLMTDPAQPNYIRTACIQVGIIGSSAGGHLAATLLAYHDDKGNVTTADMIDRVRYVRDLSFVIALRGHILVGADGM
jgi:hypothetical protein